ncbi:hypothetical protein [Paenibacillus hexagrammi]|uniref:Uncharacterized protein n=1 Tax=Paenibacillus hexagrammi TaxID=2908839 RepID=A0ABY3SJW3_9BACL|nr:hypothetical protein [Paenibacillus sp. YPD9-1]UJF33778.1 hypothetical protein L0M14_00460 [Paenibacillus sp. YPD9-1]
MGIHRKGNLLFLLVKVFSLINATISVIGFTLKSSPVFIHITVTILSVSAFAVLQYTLKIWRASPSPTALNSDDMEVLLELVEMSERLSAADFTYSVKKKNESIFNTIGENLNHAALIVSV